MFGHGLEILKTFQNAVSIGLFLASLVRADLNSLMSI